MTKPQEFYNNQLKQYKSNLKHIKKRLFACGMLRLTVFLATGFGIYLLHEQLNIAITIGIAGFALFLFLVSKNTDLRQQKKYLETLILLNETELLALNGDVSSIAAGYDYISADHYYNQDIDLFGAGSIFQFINRTATQGGERQLANFLNSNDTTSIKEKQAAIEELAKQPEWRQTFGTTARLIEKEQQQQRVIEAMKRYEAKIPALFKLLPLIFSVLSVGVITLYAFGQVGSTLLLLWFVLGLVISGAFLKKVNDLYQSAGKMAATFAQFSKLLNQIEQTQFSSSLLVQYQTKIKTDGKKASLVLKQLSGDLNSLDQRNNILFALVGNGFLLWDVRYAYRIEQWIKNYSDTVGNWFETIEFFDAFNSFGNYAFNYPTHIFPEIKNGNTILEAKALGHPLLAAEKRVTNDVQIKREAFLIITGANMAGKSTFLRTVALNIVLSNVGLPVCAASFSYSPIRLISSMRTSDSLQNDESYFFSELKRLKFIVDTIKTGEYFIILDEILKGTNSKDKEEGSKKFVQKLVATNSTGIIATHDLSLCELSTELPTIENHYFDAEIVNDELYFDYRFKGGVCQNMNASFLLRKMEIV